MNTDGGVGAYGRVRSTLLFAGCFRSLADKFHLPYCSRLKMICQFFAILPSNPGGPVIALTNRIQQK